MNVDDVDPESEVHDFLAQVNSATGDVSGTPERVRAALAELRETGSVHYSTEELEIGSRIAWRNVVHCIGRSAWRSLTIRDARRARTAEEVHEECVGHLRAATNGGRVRAVATVLAPDGHGGPGPRVLNSQLIRYAGYRQADGSVVGDRATVEFTEFAMSLGWPGGAGTPFDVLPLVIAVDGAEPRWFALPDDAVLEVPLSHPELQGLADLGLRWYAHPAISSHRLRLGGNTYSVPFSGWYIATEISARNLAGPDRYDLLPAVADHLGIKRGSAGSLWKDRALVELTAAVLHSFRRCGVTIIDHHAAAEVFVAHERREHTSGRAVEAVWRSMTAPIGASATATYLRNYGEQELLPNFVPDVCP